MRQIRLNKCHYNRLINTDIQVAWLWHVGQQSQILKESVEPGKHPAGSVVWTIARRAQKGHGCTIEVMPDLVANNLTVRHMNKSRLNFLFVGSFLFLLGASSSGFANQDIDDVVSFTGEAGSYLAARIAASDGDDLAAVSFLQKTRLLDPEDDRIKRNLFLALLSSGRVEEAVLLATEIKAANSSDQMIKLVNGVELIRKRSWAKAIDVLSGVTASDLDSLVMNIVGAWAKHGDGKTSEALKQIDDINGAEWMNVVKNLHRGLMHSANGNDAAAVEDLTKAIEMRGAAWLLTETYIDAIDALAGAQQRLGNLDGARATINSGLKNFPNLPLLHAMNEALDEGKIPGLLVSNPQQGAAELLYNLGNVLSRDNGTPLALVYLQQQRAREFYYNLRNVIHRDGVTPLAQMFLQLATHLYPENAAISISLASVFENQNNPERANSYYLKIDKTSPYKRRALLETAINLNTMDDVEGAITILRDLVDDKPSDLTPYMTLGRLLNQRERYREAADIFTKAVNEISDPQPHHWNYFYRRAISFERLKEWEKAELSFKKSIELDPNRAVVLNYLGYSWVDQGIHLDEGLDMIKKAVKMRPDAGFIVDSLGWAYYRLGRYEEAAKELEKAVEIMPNDPVVNDHLGDAYWQIGRKLEASFQWQHAIDAKPDPDEETKIRLKLETGLVETPKKPGSDTE